MSWVELTKTVVWSVPFNLTTLPLTKFDPVTVIWNEAAPVEAELGERVVRLGAGFETVKLLDPDKPPPGLGLKTVTAEVPPAAMSEALIRAVTCELLTKVVVRSEPFHLTTQPLTKLVPLTVSVKPAAPAVAEDGERPETVGTGLLTEKFCELLIPPPGAGLETLTGNCPELARSELGIAAVS